MKKGGDSGPAVVPGSERRQPDHRCRHRPRRLADASRKRGLAALGRRDRRDQGLDRPGGQEPRPTSVRSPTRATTGRFNRLLDPAVPAAAQLGDARGLGPEPDRRVPGRRTSQTRTEAAAGRRPGHLDSPRCLDLTGLVPAPKMVRALRGRSQRSSLRGAGRPAAGQPAIRRALGPALDGRLAVQRLGRLRRRGAREPAPYLAMARLDRRVAQSRPALRPHDRRHAGRRRDRPLRRRRPRAPPASWSATGTSSIATSGWRTPSSTPPRRFWASRSIAPSATITSTTRSPRPTTTPSARSSSRTRFAPTPCRASPIPPRPAWCGSSTASRPRRRSCFERGDEKRPVKEKPLAPSVPRISSSRPGSARSAGCRCRPKPFTPA